MMSKQKFELILVVLIATIVAVVVVGISAQVYAQDAFEAVAPGLQEDAQLEAEAAVTVPMPMSILAKILGWLFSATGLMLIAQALRRFSIPQKIPGWARPLIGPLLGTAAAVLSGVLGFVPDLAILEGVLLGTTAAVLFDSAKGAGLVKGTSG